MITVVNDMQYIDIRYGDRHYRFTIAAERSEREKNWIIAHVYEALRGFHEYHNRGAEYTAYLEQSLHALADDYPEVGNRVMEILMRQGNDR